MTTPAEVIEAAREFLNTPYRHQGRNPGRGLDCVGLLKAIADRIDHPVEDFTAYEEQPDPETLLREVGQRMDPVASRDGLQPGHAVMFKLHRDGPPQHFGVLTSRTSFCHSFRKVGKVVETSLGRPWSELIVGGWAFRGVNY